MVKTEDYILRVIVTVVGILKSKSKVFKYAKWPSKWLTNESLVSDLMK